ncbi:hypothetical protein BSKO_13748 [Bryopsis sp. KO-2023]|nr:hypothetical protein BSKO_13748 [Bryopsis sp. KO-2023]
MSSCKMMIAVACISVLLGCVAGQLSDAASSTCSPFLTAIVTACDGEGQSFASEVGISLPAANGDLQAVSSDATAAALANIDATPGSSCCKAICGLSNTVSQVGRLGNDFQPFNRAASKHCADTVLEKASGCGTLHHSGTECGVTPDASTCQA